MDEKSIKFTKQRMLLLIQLTNLFLYFFLYFTVKMLNFNFLISLKTSRKSSEKEE